MNTGLSDQELALMRGVMRQFPQIRAALLFGSRAKGSHRPNSDIDLALVGVGDERLAEAVAEALESLPTPYRFDVKAYDAIRHPPLLEHIRRVGIIVHET
ncbi:MAG: nucleotidyltransferase domain-containing protein [Magnetococcales bacterium]|nr:nucleotidyltransferase domain-containing protein [Magnetococcales bacterium]